MSGYVQIHRRLLGHPAFRNDAEAMAFAWLVIRASWKPSRVRYKDRIIELKRGQLAVSVRDFASAMDRDKAWIERLFKRLKSETMIETSHETGVNVITICNYSEYQAERDRGETPSETPDEIDARQGRDTEQEDKELKNINTPPLPPSGGNSARSLIPENWKAPVVSELPPKARACAEQWSPESYETHAEAFHLYWRSERKMKADWRATWANRVIALHSQVMRDQKFGNAPPSASQAKAEPKTAEQYDQSAAWFEAHGMTDQAAESRRKAAALRNPSERRGSAKPIGQLIPFRAGASR